MLSRYAMHATCAAVVAVGAVVGCASLAGLDEDYRVGDIGGSAAGTTTSATNTTTGQTGPAGGGSGGTGTGTGTTSSSTGGAGGAGGAPPLSYAEEVLRDHPVAYWRFGEGSGAVAHDSSGNDHDAEYHGAVEYSAPGAIVGDTDTAIHFAGDGADVSYELDFDDFQGQAPYTLEAWLKADQYDQTYRHLFNKDFTGSIGRENIGLYVHSGAGLGFERFVAGAKLQTATDLPDEGVWAHIVGTYDGQVLSLYVDGALVDTTDDARAQDSKPVRSFVGAKFPLANTLFGALDEFAIYDYALSEARVGDHYRVGTAQ